MSTIFFTSDTHFFHNNFLKFKDDNDQLIRPFSSVEEMNELMVERWNSVVRDGDKIYHLGDVTFDYGEDFRLLMSRLRGGKRLILGNHDMIKGTNLISFFKKVGLWRLFKDENFVCSHIPLRPDQMRKVAFNVHGHIHERTMTEPQYVNVCVEQTDYTPVSLDQIKDKITSLGGLS